MKTFKDLRILIASPDTQKRIEDRFALSKLGLRNIVEAANAAETIMAVEDAVALGDAFDVIFLEAELDDMRATDLIAHYMIYRDIYETTAFVVMVNAADTAEMQDVMKAGAVTYIDRPCTPDYFARRVSEIYKWHSVHHKPIPMRAAQETVRQAG